MPEMNEWNQPIDELMVDELMEMEGVDQLVKQIDVANQEEEKLQDALGEPLGTVPDGEKTEVFSCRLSFSDFEMIRRIIEHRYDPKIGSISDFGRHWLVFGARETAKLQHNNVFALAYQFSVADRNLQELTKKITEQLDFLDRLQQLIYRIGTDEEAKELLRRQARLTYRAAMTTQIREKILRIFPDIGG